MITNLVLENFKCFDKLELETKPLTLITGINGMGKSSVIQSLLMLRQSFDTKYLVAQEKVSLNGELITLINGNAIRYALSDSPDVNVSIELSDNQNFSATIEAGTKDEDLKCKLEYPKELNTISLFDEDFVYLSAERWGPRIEHPKGQSTNHKGRLGLGAGELTASYLFKCLSKGSTLPINKLKHYNEKTDFIYQNVSAWLSEITFDGAQITASELSPDRLELIYSFNKGKLKGFPFSPLNVGFGFSYVLPVILAVLSAKPGSLILIENPEAHLHPAAQSKIGKLLALAADNGVQIIIETHSDHLLNGIRVDVKQKKVNTNNIQIHYFTSDTIDETETKHKVSFQIKEDGKIENWPKDFFDTWEYSMMELL